ncbi:hypothetical protein [Bdellovibrio bacteriovorus]|uniref:hypothetical protein n=1 Tax=Bdellovibrio bacteriovorus TaxID=959 RepID=UPI0035A70D21
MKTKQITLTISIILSSLAANASHPLSNPKIPVRNIAEYQRERAINRLEHLFPQAGQKSHTEAIRLFSIALRTWNPELNPNDTERLLVSRVDRMGLMKGLVEPLLTLMDVSYAAGRPEFAHMLNPMLQQVAPGLARNLHERYQLPLDIQGESFQDFSNRSDLELVQFMKSTLGMGWESSPPNRQNFGQDVDFMPEAIFGRSSLFGALAQRTSTNRTEVETTNGLQRSPPVSSTPYQNDDRINESQLGANPRNSRGNTSMPGSSSSNDNDRPRGLFSKMDMAAYSSNACTTKCTSDIFNGATAGAGVPGPWFVKLAGSITGAVLGGVTCVTSAECNKDQKKDTPPKESPKPQEPKEPSQPKEPQEPKEPKEPKPKEPNPKAPPSDEDDTDDSDGGNDGESAGNPDEEEKDSIRVRLDDEFEPKIDIPTMLKEKFGRISTPIQRND